MPAVPATGDLADPLAHRGLLFTVARRYEAWGAARGLELADLVQAGLQELVRLSRSGKLAADLERVTRRGVRASTYIGRRVQGKLHRYLAKQQAFAGSSLPADEDDGLDIPDHRRQEAPALDDRELVDRLLRRLSPRERTAVALAFGLDGQEQADNLKDIGARVGGVGRERARQLLERALAKMRAHCGLSDDGAPAAEEKVPAAAGS